MGNSDWFMGIGRMFFILTLMINAGVNAFPLKTMVAHAINWELKGIKN